MEMNLHNLEVPFVWNGFASVKAFETLAKAGPGRAVADRMLTQGQADPVFSPRNGNWVGGIANMGAVGMESSRGNESRNSAASRPSSCFLYINTFAKIADSRGLLQ